MHVRSSGALLGAESVVLELAKHSAQFGYTPVVTAFQDRGDPPPELCQLARQFGVDSHTFSCGPGFDRTLPARLRAFVHKRNVSLVHCHGYKEDIHVLAARTGVAKVATNHLWKRTNWKLRLYARADAVALRCFDHIVAVSRPVFEDMTRLGLSPRRMSVIPNGIDASTFTRPLSDEQKQALRLELGISHDDIVAISVSSLTVEKGHRYMLEALPEIVRACPRLCYLVVGDGPTLGDLQRQATALDVRGHVVFAGPRTDVAALLGVAALFVLPSLIEGLPMALLEAMAAGLPAVASSTGDVPTAIEDGRNGTLCTPGSVADVAAAVQRYASDPDLRLDHGSRAQATVVENFSSASMARAYCALYDNVLSRHGRH